MQLYTRVTPKKNSAGRRKKHFVQAEVLVPPRVEVRIAPHEVVVRPAQDGLHDLYQQPRPVGQLLRRLRMSP